jgi:DNA-binding MarR family transcriptional regulator
MQSNHPLALYGRFQQIVQLANQLENRPRRFGTDERLTSAEINLIEVIGENEGSSVTELASLLTITKGAVSQRLKKLESKGFIFNSQDAQNLSRNNVSLTTKGKAAFFAHRHWHETMDGGFRNYYLGLEADKIDFLFDFLARVEEFLNKRLEADI